MSVTLSRQVHKESNGLVATAAASVFLKYSGSSKMAVPTDFLVIDTVQLFIFVLSNLLTFFAVVRRRNSTDT